MVKRSLQKFWCPAYTHLKQGKLKPRDLKCAFFRYFDGVKTYKICCTIMKPHKCIIGRDVVFNETEMLKDQAATQVDV